MSNRHRYHRHHRRRRGFTLPEVLATMVILAILLPVAMRGISIGMRGAAESRHKLEAGQLAQNKINEFLVDRTTDNLTGSGQFEAPFAEYRWESTSNTMSSSLSTDIYQVDVTVHWTSAGEDRSVTLSTLVYPSDSSGSTTQ